MKSKVFLFLLRSRQNTQAGYQARPVIEADLTKQRNLPLLSFILFFIILDFVNQ